MSEQLLHELFRGLESNVHQRLVMAEDMLQKRQESELAELVRIQGYKIDALSLQINHIVQILSNLQIYIQPSPVPVSAPAPAPAPAPVSAPAPAPVSAPAPAPTQITLKNVLVSPPVANLEEIVDDAEIEFQEEEVEEEEIEEQEVEEQEVEEQEVEEQEELEEFIYKNKTYYRDGENQVYQLDDEGNLDDNPIGRWDDKTKRIRPI